MLPGQWVVYKINLLYIMQNLIQDGSLQHLFASYLHLGPTPVCGECEIASGKSRAAFSMD